MQVERYRPSNEPRRSVEHVFNPMERSFFGERRDFLVQSHKWVPTVIHMW